VIETFLAGFRSFYRIGAPAAHQLDRHDVRVLFSDGACSSVSLLWLNTAAGFRMVKSDVRFDAKNTGSSLQPRPVPKVHVRTIRQLLYM